MLKSLIQLVHPIVTRPKAVVKQLAKFPEQLKNLSYAQENKEIVTSLEPNLGTEVPIMDSPKEGLVTVNDVWSYEKKYELKEYSPLQNPFQMNIYCHTVVMGDNISCNTISTLNSKVAEIQEEEDEELQNEAVFTLVPWVDPRPGRS